MKFRIRFSGHALSLTTLLALACGRSPTEDGGSDSISSTGASEATSTTTVAPTSSVGSVSEGNTATEATSQGSMSAGQTEATTSTAGTVTNGVTSTETASDTGTTNPATTDTGTSSTDPSASDTDATGDPATTDATTDSTTTTTDGTTTDATTDGTTTDGTTGEAIQCGVQLKATIRDFKLGHPDFQTYCCGVVLGLVQATLGPDKKPVFNQVGNPQMLTDAPTFNQWYNNVQDVNQSTQIILDLQEIMPGVYSYQNNSFFPIDDMLFGNQGNNHNFHFTTVPDTS